MNNTLPLSCPSCHSGLHVTSMQCVNCSTGIEGKFGLPVLVLLDYESQEFILNFVKHSGSLKNLASQMKLSYPTVRNRLDEIIEKINGAEKKVR